MLVGNLRIISKEIIIFMIIISLMIIVNIAFAGGGKEQIKSEEYQERPTLETSLFKSDQDILSEEDINKILSSKFELPNKIKIAVIKLRSDERRAIYYYGYNYWRSEEFLKNQQNIIDTLTEELYKSERVLEVTLLPEILTPREPTVSVLRVATVRMQADVLLVFYLSSDIYRKTRFLAPDQVKAYCTVEAFLLDVRTGLIPFSSINTEDILTKKIGSDAGMQETSFRAENEAVLKALKTLGNEFVEFLIIVPQTIKMPEELTEEQVEIGKIELRDEVETPNFEENIMDDNAETINENSIESILDPNMN